MEKVGLDSWYTAQLYLVKKGLVKIKVKAGRNMELRAKQAFKNPK